MKIGILSDTHIGLTRDSFKDEIKRNYKKAIEILKDCDLIIHAGDIFDRNVVDVNMLTTFLEPIRAYNLKLFYILGNHDIMRSNLEPALDKYSKLKGEQNQFLSKLDNERLRQYSNDIVNIVGIDYDDRLIKEKLELAKTRLDKSKYNILVIHQDLADFLQTEFAISSNYLLNLGFQLVINGHIHKYSIKRNLLIPGSTSITTFDKEDLTSIKYVHILDTNRQEIQSIPIPDQTSGYYFEMDEVGKTQEQIQEDISKLIDQYKNKFIKIVLKTDRPVSLGSIVDNPYISLERSIITKDAESLDFKLIDIDVELKKDWKYDYSYEEFIKILDEDLEDTQQRIELLINLKKM